MTYFDMTEAGYKATNYPMYRYTVEDYKHFTRRKPALSKSLSFFAKPTSFPASIGKRLTSPYLATGKAIQSGLRLRYEFPPASLV